MHSLSGLWMLNPEKAAGALPAVLLKGFCRPSHGCFATSIRSSSHQEKEDPLASGVSMCQVPVPPKLDSPVLRNAAEAV